MKKIICALVLSLLAISACKKDDSGPENAFSKLTYQDIQKVNGADFTKNNITVVSGTVGVLKPGAILFFTSTDGYYGKMKIVSNGLDNDQFSLKFDVVVYALDGNSTIIDGKGSIVKTGEYFKLSTGSVSNALNVTDFSWLPQQNNLVIKPLNNATFYIYSKE